MNNFILVQETYYKFVLVWPEENKVFLYTPFWHTEHEPIFRVTQDFKANILYEIHEIEFQFPLFFVFIITFMVYIFCK